MAGRSASLERERRRANRIRHAEESGGRIRRWAAELSPGPQHERAWSAGAKGEAENARRLDKRLAGSGALVLHDRRVPGKRANIDHIAVGPSGVVVIDSKNLKGRVKVDWHGGLFKPREFDLYVNGRRRTNLIEKVEAQMEVVRAAIATAELANVPVRGAICMAKVEGLPLLSHPKIRDVAIDGTRHIAKLVTAAGPLDAERIAEVAAVLDKRLPPA